MGKKTLKDIVQANLAVVWDTASVIRFLEKKSEKKSENK